MARIGRCAAAFSPRCSSSITQLQKVPTGLARPLPMMSKAEPWNRLEHRRVATFRVDIAGGGDAQTACEGSGEIAQNVGVQIGGDQGVEARGRFTMRAVAASTSSLSHFTSGNSPATCAAISSHMTIAWRCALLLVTTVSSLRGRDCARRKAKRRMRSTPAGHDGHASVAASMGWP